MLKMRGNKNKERRLRIEEGNDSKRDEKWKIGLSGRRAWGGEGKRENRRET